MVGPEDDDGVAAIGAGGEGVEDAADVGVGVVDAGEVAGDGAFPLAGGGDVIVVAEAADGGFGHVGEVVFEHGGEGDGVLWEFVEVLFRGVPGEVGAVEAAGEEEGLVVAALEEVAGPAGEAGVGGVLVLNIEGAPIEVACAGDLIDGSFGGVEEAVEVVVGLPGGGLILAAVEDFAAAEDGVAAAHEVLREGDGVGGAVAPDVAVGVDAGGGGAEAGHEAGAGGVAAGGLAVGAAEGDAAFGEGVDVGGDGLGVAGEGADPVVEIVNGDKEHVGAAWGLGVERGAQGGREPLSASDGHGSDQYSCERIDTVLGR
jgi:hypothetical protein